MSVSTSYIQSPSPSGSVGSRQDLRTRSHLFDLRKGRFLSENFFPRIDDIRNDRFHHSITEYCVDEG